MICLNEIKSGDIVKLKDGSWCLVYDKIYLMETSHGVSKKKLCDLTQYNSNLRHKHCEKFDIMEVYLKPVLNIVDSDEKWVRQPEKEISKEEKTILENVYPKYSYITRDKDGTLTIWAKEVKEKELFKDEKSGKWIFGEMNQKLARGILSVDFSVFKHLFKFISWEDTRPINVCDKLCYNKLEAEQDKFIRCFGKFFCEDEVFEDVD